MPNLGANLLGALGSALGAIETNMGEPWRETVVITEFGRTAPINGTDGTDHRGARSRCSPEARSTAAA